MHSRTVECMLAPRYKKGKMFFADQRALANTLTRVSKSATMAP